MAALPQKGLSFKVVQLLGLWGSWQCQVCLYMNCLSHRSYGLIRAFSKSLASGDQKASLAGPPLLHPFLSTAAWLSSKYFSPQSAPTSPPSVSLQSMAAPTLGLLHNPYAPTPRRCTFQGTHVPVWGLYGYGKDCLCASRSIYTVTDYRLHSQP